jgi:hypothetical protein
MSIPMFSTEPSKDDIAKLMNANFTVDVLRTKCRDSKLSTSGTKSVLIGRLIDSGWTVYKSPAMFSGSDPTYTLSKGFRASTFAG